MFPTPAMDVAIGLILMYLMLSLLCTVVNEFIATKLSLRSKSLAAAIEQLIMTGAMSGAASQFGLMRFQRDSAKTAQIAGAR